MVIQRIAPEHADWFLEWQRGISSAAATCAGYLATDVYPPHESEGGEWVVVLHFDQETNLKQWLDSPLRASWIQQLLERGGNYEVKTLPGGFSDWFTSQSRPVPVSPPPAWKMALTVLLALYPTVVLLSLLVGPILAPLGFPLAMLVSNALSVALLQWGVMPAVTFVLRPWLRCKGSERAVYSLAGGAAILGVLVCLMLLFRFIDVGT